MGNLGRPGYGATTDGLWRYSYNTCDVGTLPNQTFPDHSGPLAALHTDAGRAQYNHELSWLPGQRLSSCTCPGEDHPNPGPFPKRGRGAPEIDVFEGERNKTGAPGGIVSQSAQFAPFTADYLFDNSTSDKYTIFNPSTTVPNSYRGSAVQQSVSALTDVPDNMFEGSGQVFTKFGLEYWADPDAPENGFITWMVNGNPSHRVAADAMGPDPDGTGVGRRLIPEEPMSLILNLGISESWQKIDHSTLTFPTEMLVDYVRIYQRKGHENVGCSPDGYPTEEYINNHPEAYNNPNLTTWRGGVEGGAGYTWPRNSLASGGC